MKQKLEILARLLRDNHITTDEFLTLTEVEYKYIYNNYPYTYTWNVPYIQTTGGWTLTTNTQVSPETTLASSATYTNKMCSCDLVHCTCNSKN